MINTFFNSGTLDSPAAFLASLLIGLAFGVALERAGFGSSRRLAGIFYFRDMAVLKVMFTAVIVAMLGLSYAKAFGWVTTDNVYFLPTLYAAQILGGLLFGIGFVMSWDSRSRPGLRQDGCAGFSGRRGRWKHPLQ
jgi:thiosulfate/3-mercaptopyruvate sulfurtransferase